jgi:hypothetical protein
MFESFQESFVFDHWQERQQRHFKVAQKNVLWSA